jgi:hypothetical protein
VKIVARATAETAMVVGLLGWVYVAVLAAARTTVLSQHIAAVLPVRRDTFGAVCLLCSALSAFALRARTGAYWIRLKSGGGVLDAALRTTAIYALLVWTYLSVNSVTHPRTIGMRLVHFWSSPSEGTTAVICFAAAAVALFLIRLRGGDRG